MISPCYDRYDKRATAKATGRVIVVLSYGQAPVKNTTGRSGSRNSAREA